MGDGAGHVDDLIRLYATFLIGTPLGIIILLVCTALLIGALAIDRAKWVLLAILLAISVTGSPGTASSRSRLPPFPQIALLAQPLLISCLFMLAIKQVPSPVAMRSRPVGAPAKVYLMFQFYLAIALCFGGAFSRGLLDMAVFSVMFISLAYGLGKWLQKPEDAYRLIHALLCSCMFLAGATALHLLVRRSSVLEGGRLAGITANSNGLAVYLAFFLPVTIATALRKEERKSWRIAAVVSLSVSIIFIAASLSRSGAMTAVLGILVFFRRRLGQFAVLGVVVVVTTMIALVVFGNSVGDVSRLVSLQDTRSGVMSRLVADFLANPFFGRMETTAYGECSYLSVLAAYGLFGAIPFVIFLVFVLRDTVRVLRRRSSFGAHRLLADAAVATTGQFFFLCIFGADLLGTLTFSVFLLYICFSMYSLLLDPNVFGATSSQGGFEQPADVPDWDMFADPALAEQYLNSTQEDPFSMQPSVRGRPNL